MNRQSFLKAHLMGDALEISCARSAAWHKWATVHEPLLSPSTYTVTGRHLNHFSVGSDPEFSFMNMDGERIEAHSCGLKVGLVAGSDQNERLVELRPWPSTSVVEHLAGILTALRWLYRVYNRTAGSYWWRAGAYFAGDGMGGHVHFGRKRPTRGEEVAALDGLARAFRATGLFPNREWDRRIQGDRLGQHYGAPGDFRIQRHGYEYRSLPSWLQSPTVAFIAVAASKLAVLDPQITTTWSNKLPSEVAGNLLRGLAKLYKGRDDDAYILYHLLTRQGDDVFRVNYNIDFAPAWGIPRDAKPTKAEEGIILPDSIVPAPEEIVEMREHLLTGSPLAFRLTAPNFTHSIPTSKGYKWLPAHVIPNRRSGFGDLLHNLVQHVQHDFLWDYSNHDEFKVTGMLPVYWSKDETALLKRFFPRVQIRGVAIDGNRTSICVPRCLCQTQSIAGLRAMLLNSGLFPLWTVDTVTDDSIVQWIKSHPEQKTTATWRFV